MRKRRQPNSAGFLAPTGVQKTVEVAPVVEVEPAVETVVEPEPVVAEPEVVEVPEVDEVDEVAETVEPVTKPAAKETVKTEDDTTDEVAF